MKLVLLAAACFAVAALCPTVCVAAPRELAPEPIPIWAYAPADEYFGPLKMSILGVNNAIVNVRRHQSGGVMSDASLASLNQVRLSIRDASKHYPRDPWIARAISALEGAYALFSDPRAHRHAGEAAMWLLWAYPRSIDAVRLRAELARTPGFFETRSWPVASGRRGLVVNR